MIKKIVILFLLVLCFQCKNNRIERPPKPDNLISEEQMVEVLYDMALMSSAKGLNRRIIENNGIFPDVYIYEKHGIDSLQFMSSNAYYAYDIDLYDNIYKRVKAKLQADKEHFNSLVESGKTAEDSISRQNQRRRDSIIKLRTDDANLNP